MVNSRQKGSLGEKLVQDMLCKATGHKFEQTPGSGSGVIKGDLYILDVKNNFCIEVKNYSESPLSDKILTNKTNNLTAWWTKLVRQASGCKQDPLLIYKYNRSKLFVVTDVKPTKVDKFLYLSTLKCYIMLCEEWLEQERPTWFK